jgi:hypothetical protein
VIALGVVMGGELAGLAGKEAASKPEARSSRPRSIGHVLSPTALGLCVQRMTTMFDTLSAEPDYLFSSAAGSA